MSTKCVQQAGLRIAVGAVSDFDAECAAALQERQLRSHHLPTGLDQRRIDASWLAGGRRHVPPVDQHVDHAVAGVHGTRYGPVRDGTGRVECAGHLEDSCRCFSRAIVGVDRVGSQDVAIEIRTERIAKLFVI